MTYTCTYDSPLGRILLASDENGLSGLWFEGSRHFARELTENASEGTTEALRATVKWLDIYFGGEDPGFTPPLVLTGSVFRQTVSRIMLDIPYGQTLTYGEIAVMAAERLGMVKMSPQAVGGAVGHNPITLIVPCHRVVGSGGNLTGYGGGLERKIHLLELEGTDMNRLHVPAHVSTWDNFNMTEL